MGSPDTYNLIEFRSGGSLLQSFSGNQLINPADGNWATGEYINFAISGGSVDQIVLTSTRAAFETDNHAFAAVPEPFTLGITGAALVVIGLIRRRRQA
jgi:hypothetical protein